MTVNELMLAAGNSLAASILAKITVTTALALVIARFARHSRAAVRHVLLAAAFVVLLVLPMAAIVAPSIPVPLPVVAWSAALSPAIDEPAIEVQSGASGNVGTDPVPAPTRSTVWSTSAILIAAWGAGVALFLAPMLVGLWQMRVLRRSVLPWRRGASVVESLARGAGIVRRVEVVLHESIPGPMTCGVVRSAIVLPMDAQTWPAEDLHRAVVHELEHVRRGDWLTQTVARAMCAVYWFHPLVWIARRRLVLEAERACDDAVLSVMEVEAAAYADQLVGLAERLSTAAHPPLLAMANRHDLATRVVAVLDSRQPRGRAGAVAVAIVGVASALLVMAMSPLKMVAEARMGAQTATTGAATFQVASIKPCDPSESTGGRSGGGGGGFGASPGRIYFQCMPVTEIIRRAYVQFGDPPPPNAPSLFGDLIKAAPAWASSDRYTIEAKAEGTPPTTTMMGAMLRALLEDRFKLKIHQEMKDVPGYALTVANGGFKLQPVPAGTCAQPDPNYIGPRVLTASGVFTGTPGPGDKPLCTGGVGRNGANLTYDVTGQSLDRVARTLGGLVLGRPIVDRTGITGQFSFHLEFANVENVVTQPGTLPAGPPDVSSVASIFSVFEKQLGLKLVAAKVPQGSLVIDHLERPSNGDAIVVQTPVARAARAKYDVASIKRCEEEPVPTGARGTAGGTNASISPGRFQVPCVTAEQLIYLAYASYGVGDGEHLVNDDPGSASNAIKVRGGPEWVHSLKEKYQIEATAVGATERSVLMGSMLQSLLEDRFKLKLHRETEQVDMLELKLGKDGLKMKPMKDDDCVPYVDGSRPDPNAAKPMCGSINMAGSTAMVRWTFGGFALSSLASMLSRDLKVHVIDSTSVSDKFVFRFEFQRDDTASSSLGGQVETRDPAGRGQPMPSLNAALEAIGLKVEKTKAPRGYLVIDSIDRPTPNTPAADALPPARAMGPRR